MTIKVIRRPPQIAEVEAPRIVRLPARRTDPETSKVAAEAMTERVKGRVRGALWTLVHTLPPSTDEEMWAAYELLLISGQVPKATDARLRHCRKDLVDMGLLHDTGAKRANRSGYEATVWGLA